LDEVEVSNASSLVAKPKELWGFVDGTETLGKDATLQQRADPRKKLQKALSVIVMEWR
jgi:hypothetical protein